LFLLLFLDFIVSLVLPVRVVTLFHFQLLPAIKSFLVYRPQLGANSGCAPIHILDQRSHRDAGLKLLTQSPPAVRTEEIDLLL